MPTEKIVGVQSPVAGLKNLVTIVLGGTKLGPAKFHEDLEAGAYV